MSLILVPIDGGPQSERALQNVIERARRRSDLRAALLFVREPPARPGRVLVFQRAEDVRAFSERRGAQLLEDAARRLEAAGVATETHVAEGDLYPTVARVAGELGASEVVLGVRPRWGTRLAAALARLRPLESLRVPVTWPS